MKALKSTLTLMTVAVLGSLAGCSTASTKAPDVSASLRASLDQAGFKDITINQDRDKGVVTLSGHVAADAEVVADEIAVRPPGVEHEAKDIDSDLDKGIEHNLDAALIQSRLHEGVKYSVKNEVVTLTGDVDSENKRAEAQNVASSVLNVRQVVNELQVKAQKASSSN